MYIMMIHSRSYSFLFILIIAFIAIFDLYHSKVYIHTYDAIIMRL